MNDIFSLETTKYKIKIENFEGPLDLLCHLIEVNKMDIYDVNINEIADQYIEYINKMQQMDMEVTSEFLVMASNLLYIKSKKLLPHYEEDDEEMLSEEELLNRIIEYKRYKEITKKMQEMLLEGSKRIFRKMPEQIELPKQELEVKYTKEDLSKYYSDVINRNSVRLNKNAKNIEKIAIVESYSVGDTVKTMFRELIRKSHFIFNKLYSINNCKPQEVITAFSGLLEMSRRNKVVTDQKVLFGDIEVSKKKKTVLSENNNTNIAN